MATSDSELRIAVFGERGCGKSTFIETVYSENKTEQVLVTDDYRMYPCQIMVKNEMKSVRIYEISCRLILMDVIKVLHECLPNCIVLMYAINSRKSFGRAYNIFVSAIKIWKSNAFLELPSALVATHKDLREQENPDHVSYDDGKFFRKYTNMTVFIECSNDLDNMKDAWKLIFDM